MRPRYETTVFASFAETSSSKHVPETAQEIPRFSYYSSSTFLKLSKYLHGPHNLEASSTNVLVGLPISPGKSYKVCQVESNQHEKDIFSFRVSKEIL